MAAAQIAPPEGFELDGAQPQPGAPRAPQAPAGFQIDQPAPDPVLGAINQSRIAAPIEAGLNLVTGLGLGMPVYLARGLYGALTGEEDRQEKATEAAHAVTYEPRGEKGKRLSALINLPFEKLTEKSTEIGHKVTDLTGSPVLGAITEGAIQTLTPLGVAKGAGTLAALGRSAPTPAAFESAAVAIEGHAPRPGQTPAMAGKLERIYEATGKKPSEVIAAALQDSNTLADLVADNREIPAGLEKGKAKETGAPAAEPGAPAAEPEAGGVKEAAAGETLPGRPTHAGEEIRMPPADAPIPATNLPRATDITLVRHGETALNNQNLVRGWTDIPLNEMGAKQAGELGEQLKDKGIDTIVTSDLVRASATAREIGKASGAPVIEDPAFRPWNVGEYAGKPNEAVARVLEDYASNRPSEPLPGGESFNQFRERYLSGVERIAAEHPGERIALVSHHRGDRLFAAWQKAAMPVDHSVDMSTFLDWQGGIKTGTAADMEPVPVRAGPQGSAMAAAIGERMKAKGAQEPEVKGAVAAWEKWFAAASERYGIPPSEILSTRGLEELRKDPDLPPELRSVIERAGSDPAAAAFERDAQEQIAFLNREAKSRGFADIDQLAKKDPEEFQKLASAYRAGRAKSEEPLPIPYAQRLRPEQREVETRAREQVQGDLEGQIKAYEKLPDSDGGKIINTDIARELFPDYRQSRSIHSPSVHEPASALVKEMFLRKVSEADPNGLNMVTFTAGGTGAGKTSGINAVPLVSNVVEASQLVYDTNMANFKSAKAKIDLALEHGKQANIIFVGADPLEALDRALKRAMRTGRTVPLEEHAKTHEGSARALEQLMQEYKGDDRVQFIIIDNGAGAKGEIRLVDPADAREYLHSLDFSNLRERLKGRLDAAFEQGKITEAIYRGTEAPVGEGEGTAPGAGGGEEPPAGGQPGERGAAGAPRGRYAPLRERGGPPRPPEIPPPSPAQAAVLERISKEPGKPAGYTWEAFYADVKDDLYPIKRLVNALRSGEDLGTAEDPYKLARLTRGAYGKAEQFLEYSPFDFKTYKNVGKSMRDIIDPVKNDLDGLRAYAVSRRSVELDGRGIQTGVPLDEAKQVIAEGGKYAQVLKELQAYQDHLVAYLKDSGVLSEESVKAMREANKDYVPFFRLMDDAEGAASAGAGLKTHQPIKRIKGSERLIIDPLESIVKNTYLYTTLAERNAVGRSLVELVERSGRDDLVRRIPGPVKPIKVQDAEIRKFLEENGIDAPEEFEQAMTIFRRGNLTPAEDQIVVFREGKRELYQVPEEVASAFKATDRESAGWLTRVLAIPAKMLRVGATLSPDFISRNPVRDQFSAYVLSKSGYVPVLDMVRGAVSIAKHDQDFQNWLKSGGANAAMVSLDRDYVQQELARRSGDLDFTTRAWNVIKNPLEPLRIASELMENATRLGEFKKAAGGESTKEAIQSAGFEAREVTIDFARIGAKTRAMNLITAFWNANLEGIDRTVRSFKDRPFQTTAKMAVSITLPSVLLWWSNHDDGRYGDLPNWEKDLFWIVMTDHVSKERWAGMSTQKKLAFQAQTHIYRIPKPFELGVIFGSGPERLLDAFYDKHPDAFKDFTNSMANTMGINLVPTAAAPVLGQITNWNFFTDRPLIPASQERLLPEYQYSSYTTQTTRALGHLVGSIPGLHDKSMASPQVIDNYIRSWTGTLGNYTLQIADAALRKTGVLPDPIRPAKSLEDLPVLRGFMVRFPSGQAQSIQDFYDSYQASKRVTDTIQTLARQGDSAAALREMQLDPQRLARLDSIHQALSRAQEAIQLVDRNPKIGEQEKRQLIDTMYYQMMMMSRAGNLALAQMQKALASSSLARAKEGAPNENQPALAR
jgi:broad specificity phosphatase PhoE